MENLFSFIPFAAIVVAAVFAVLYSIDKKLAKKIAIRTAVFVVAVIAFALILTLHGVARAEKEIPWQHAVVNGSVEVEFNGDIEYLVVFTTEDGYVLSYFDDAEIVKGTRIRVKISPYGETLDAEVEEPEPIWFPPILMLGAVAPIVKQTKKGIVRIQKMPVEREKGRTKQDFRLPVALESKQTTFVYYEGLLRKSVAVDTVDNGLQLIKRATDKNYPAYLTAFVPAYNQQAVVATNWLGDLGYWFKTSIYFRVEEAYKALTTSVCVKDVVVVKDVPNSKIGKGGKDDPAVMMVLCTIDEDLKQRLYTFRTLEALSIGDRRTAHLKSGDYKPVTVKEVLPPCFASQLDHPLDWYVTLEVFLLKEHENIGVGRRIPANGVLTEEEMAAAQRRVDSMVYCDQDVINEAKETEQAE